VNRQFTTPKSKKSRRVDLSKQLRHVLLQLRNERLVKTFNERKSSIADDLVFPSPEGSVLDPDNLIKRYFLPCIEHAGLRRFRFHDLRHSFGSLLIQDGASLAYVKEQMGHSSIQVTVDTYGHLIRGANVSWVDRLDTENTPHQNAPAAHQAEKPQEEEFPQTVGNIGGGGWTRTNDLRIMRPSL
jgi:integrase